ncbi:right-handed parallel beta-helix repeat-containing protein [Haloprofundus salilacus]|uniref:right-handed parallel beta-helix repeat-containing protein n=1 Tax=Haloprofundus salilacus TaxID=2876190 RepID=UPI001CCF1D30|nr:right-handed parallel beta-helix repeat-containing protein [Haloprofundus salilacus]
MVEDGQDSEPADPDGVEGVARRELLTAVAGVSGLAGLAGCFGLFDSDQSQPQVQNGTVSGGGVNGTVPAIVVWQDDGGVVRADAGDGQVQSGRQPAAVIQAAIDISAQRPGIQSIEVVGNYALSEPVNLKRQTVLNLRDAHLTAGGNHAVISVDGVSNAAVVGGVLDGSNQTDGEQYLGVLALNGADHVVVDGCEVRNGGYYGVNLYECNNCLLSGIRARDNYRHGIHPGSDTENRGYFNWLIQCITDNNGVDGINDRGTTVAGESLNNAFYNCLSRNNGRSGFILAGGVESDRVTTQYDVIGCRSFENESHGIQFTNCRASAVNVVTQSNGHSGLLLEGGVRASILNPRTNDHSGPESAGITIRDGVSASPSHVVIYGGEATNNSRNVRIETSSDVGPITLRDIDLRGAGEQTLAVVNSYPSALTVSNTPGYRTSNRGDLSRSGDGSTTTFRWQHYLAEQPRSVTVTPATGEAASPFSVTADNDNIVVTYRNPPGQGNENLRWWWEASAY